MSHELHNAVIADANYVRTSLGEANIANFELIVKVSGRTLSDPDECKVEFTVSSGWSHTVKGDSVEACVEELLRRVGWHKDHMPTALAKPRTANRAKAIAAEWMAEANVEPTND